MHTLSIYLGTFGHNFQQWLTFTFSIRNACYVVQNIFIVPCKVCVRSVIVFLKISDQDKGFCLGMVVGFYQPYRCKIKLRQDH